MRIPLNWLRDYIDIKISPEKLAEKLLMSGTEVEILKSGIDLDDRIVVGEVLEIKKHPNADRLNIAKVRIAGSQQSAVGGIIEVVCGGTNLETGQKVPVALLGAVIGEFEIKETEIRGEKSHGMICSETELGISDHATTEIMVLGADAKVGAKVKDILGKGEVVLDAEITPNRGDLLSIIGIARDLAAVLKTPVKLPKIKLNETKDRAEYHLNVRVVEKDLCPRYVARVIKIKKNRESPKWMRERLEAAGVRPISAVVDITNYVMLELGQPLHAFDFSKLADKRGSLAKARDKSKRGLTQIVVRRAKEGEKIETLDGAERKLIRTDLIIIDGKKPIAIAGVMGGKNTEVDEKTKMIVLESATFDKTSVRKTAQRLALRSESSNRFEKGIPMSLNPIAIDRAAELIQKICGGEILQGRIDVQNKWSWVQHIGLRISRIKEFLGEKIPANTAVGILNNLGFEAEKFDIIKEAKKHLGKPYVFGASFKTHGTDAFDCSYLTDYIYSKIGKFIGYTSLAQIELGRPVKEKDLKPGDILFMKGVIDKSAVGYYFVPDEKGGYKKVTTKKFPKGVGHNAIYIGNGKIIHASHFEYDLEKKKWMKPEKERGVIEESADVFLNNPEYLGARRYEDNLDDYIAVTVPWWRLDVTIEEDLLEEIARIYGYDKIKTTIPSGILPGITENRKLKLIEKTKDTLKGLGFSETINYPFISKKDFANAGLDSKKALKIANPISSDQEIMRTSLIPSILANVSKNQTNFDEIKIFEAANVYIPKGKGLPEEKYCLAGAVSGGEFLGIDYPFDKEFYATKSILLNLLEKIGISSEKIDFKNYTRRSFEKGKSAEVFVGGKSIGVFGEMDVNTKAGFDIKKRVTVFDIDLEPILNLSFKVKNYIPIPKYPSIKRDFSFVVDSDTEAGAIIKVIERLNLKYLFNQEITDIYFGKELGEGKKSITVGLEFLSEERTLEDIEVDKESERIVKTVEAKLKAKLRD